MGRLGFLNHFGAALLLSILVQAEASFAETEAFFADLNGDGMDEIIYLTENSAGYDLVIDDGTIIATAPNFVESDPSDETWPSFNITGSGSLEIIAEQFNGAHKWRQVLTIAFHDNAYRLAGIRIQTWGNAYQQQTGGDVGPECDLNILMGTGWITDPETRELVLWKANVEAISIDQWSDQVVKSACPLFADS